MVSNNTKTLAKILARVTSDNPAEAIAAISKACELLKVHGKDWHDVVAAIERTDILADPKPNPHAAANAEHVANATKAAARKAKAAAVAAAARRAW